MTTTTKPNPLTDMPIYATKPTRRIPGTKAVAVTMYRSADNSVREFAILTADGQAHLGTAHWQPKRGIYSAGYTMTYGRDMHTEQWPNLTQFALAMAERLGVQGVQA